MVSTICLLGTNTSR